MIYVPFITQAGVLYQIENTRLRAQLECPSVLVVLIILWFAYQKSWELTNILPKMLYSHFLSDLLQCNQEKSEICTEELVLYLMNYSN